MGKTINISKKKPSEILKIIESNPKLKRNDFGCFRTDRPWIIDLVLNPWFISFSALFIWAAIFFLFVNPGYDEDGGVGYLSWLLTQDYFYTLPLVFSSGPVKYLISKGINKYKVENEFH